MGAEKPPADQIRRVGVRVSWQRAPGRLRKVIIEAWVQKVPPIGQQVLVLGFI
jgi:hypothetical protein